jgi:hypothetical protein
MRSPKGLWPEKELYKYIKQGKSLKLYPLDWKESVGPEWCHYQQVVAIMISTL